MKLATLAAVGALASCGEDKTAALRSKARAWGADLDCSDVSMLQPAEAATRGENAYRQHSDREDQFCLDCSNFVPPGQESACGTCKTVRGPINPDGWCKQWTKSRG